jgi:hypothetical protein
MRNFVIEGFKILEYTVCISAHEDYTIMTVL